MSQINPLRTFNARSTLTSMGLDHFPFVAVTVTALFVHITSAIVATVLQPAWKGDTFLDRWWGPASTVRLFTVKRIQVQKPFSWGCIVTARVALMVAALSLALDLGIN